jgi:hypothetical protein
MEGWDVLRKLIKSQDIPNKYIFDQKIRILWEECHFFKKRNVGEGGDFITQPPSPSPSLPHTKLKYGSQK